MNWKQSSVYALFSGMSAIDNKKNLLDFPKIIVYATTILQELEIELPTPGEVKEYIEFIGKVDRMCGDIMLK